MIPQRDGPLGMSGAGFELRVLMGGGTTVLFVSHNIEQIKKMCSKCVWLERGTIKMCGNAQHICAAYQGK